MGQLYGQLKNSDGTTNWKPIAAIPQPDGTFAIMCDTELILDSGTLNLSNLKVGSVNQTSSTLRYILTDDSGRIIIANNDPFIKYKAADSDSSGIVKYHGFVDEDENWFIMREDDTTSTKELRYISGQGNYITNYANKLSLSYDYLFNVTIF